MLDRDLQEKVNEVEITMLELNHRIRELEAQREMLEAELQIQINDKEAEPQKALEQHEQQRRKEE